MDIVRIGNDYNSKDVTDVVSYVTDIHLLHRYKAWKCESEEDRNKVRQMVADQISKNDPNVRIKLIGGDVSGDFEEYKSFVSLLSRNTKQEDFFFTLGNHELWPFVGERLESIVERYKTILQEKGIRLVHNNLYYYESDNSIKEITTEELSAISLFDLMKRLIPAKLIVFGGVGFAGLNNEYNADNGIYEGALSRAQEIGESIKFEKLYNKVIRALRGKRAIVFTHMHIQNWTTAALANGIVYVSGHDHRNRYYDNGQYRIYADNQIGYNQKSFSMKHLSLTMRYDSFSKYEDGIYAIDRDNYINFYRSRNEYISLNRSYKDLYMLKREGFYMFFLTTQNDKLHLLDGGSIKNVGNHNLEYFYERMVPYGQSIYRYLAKFDDFQKHISREIKELGGEGNIHGCIVDVDFFNHLYINPLDYSITPYYAPYSMVEKYVYNNIPSLLKYKCPQLYLAYKKHLAKQSGKDLLVYNGDLTISAKTQYVESTEMYRMSGVLNKLQFLTKHNIIKIWGDEILGKSSEETGKKILAALICPKKRIESDENSKRELILHTIDRIRRKGIFENKPIEHKIDWNKKERKYKIHVESMTKTIEVLKYNGSEEYSEYQCKLCGHIWKQKPSRFKLKHICPNCKK